MHGLIDRVGTSVSTATYMMVIRCFLLIYLFIKLGWKFVPLVVETFGVIWRSVHDFIENCFFPMHQMSPPLVEQSSNPVR